MLWLVWHMWILILLAFAGGVIAGWVIRSRSDETPDRPMLEKLDATVVAPVDTPKADTPKADTPKADTPKADEAAAEPKAAADPEPEPTPAPKAKTPAASKTAPKPAKDSPADDLTEIKGLGPKAAEKLNAEGVTRLSQIAAWTDADVDRFDALINGRGRIVRDEWVKQAKALVG